jgi:hypothetical protein
MMTFFMHMFVHTRASQLCGILFYVKNREMWNGIGRHVLLVNVLVVV